uniref:Uncharacterized protein n=1 Tax=viral metagenome TaxID=1070528 RepID=A0A6C0D4L0_9ZZZZ
MKFDRTTCCILCGVVFLIIIVSLFSGSGYTPYTPVNLFAKQFPYEGFADYSSTSSNSSMDSYKSLLIDSSQGGDCKKVDGFDGLFCQPYVADNKIDPFADTPGSLSCYGSSSGLSNSKGSLCLTDSQKKMLATRGGNQTGAPSSLG